VLVAVTNYAVLSLVEIAYTTVYPLFLSTPIQVGGLGFSPPVIGYILSFLGIARGIFHLFFFVRIHNRWGTKIAFMSGMALGVPIFILFPVMNVWARERGVDTGLWVLVVMHIICSSGFSLCYGRILLLVKRPPLCVLISVHI